MKLREKLTEKIFTAENYPNYDLLFLKKIFDNGFETAKQIAIREIFKTQFNDHDRAMVELKTLKALGDAEV